jgi:hypothetical protein
MRHWGAPALGVASFATTVAAILLHAAVAGAAPFA